MGWHSTPLWQWCDNFPQYDTQDPPALPVPALAGAGADATAVISLAAAVARPVAADRGPFAVTPLRAQAARQTGTGSIFKFVKCV